MGSEERKGLPSFWVTSIAKSLSGDQPCALSVWMGGHYDLEKRVRDDQGTLARWKAEHSAQLESLVSELQRADWNVRKESYFRVKGHTAIIAGKADVVTQGKERRPKIWDVKSGRPRDSDVTQVLIEMVIIPMAWESPSMLFDGCVVYPTHRVELKPAQAQELKPRIFAKLKELATMPKPLPTPGRDACRFCDLSDEDCAERFRVDAPDAETLEF